jgi:hypothetical protein
MDSLLRPAHLYRAADVLARPTVVPASAGIYAWYFDDIPTGVDPAECHRHDDRVLLYAGISPNAPRLTGRTQAAPHCASACGPTTQATPKDQH